MIFGAGDGEHYLWPALVRVADDLKMCFWRNPCQLLKVGYDAIVAGVPIANGVAEKLLGRWDGRIERNTRREKISALRKGSYGKEYKSTRKGNLFHGI